MISISGIKDWLFPEKETIEDDEDVGTSALLEAFAALRARTKAQASRFGEQA